METVSESLASHRVQAAGDLTFSIGSVHWVPIKSTWFFGMAAAAFIGGALQFSWTGVALYAGSTATVLLLGHSLGSHRKLIHESFQCPRWLEYLLVYLGVQVGLAGPIGLLRQHEVRDYAQRIPGCHDYLRHGRSFWIDAWWQINCDLKLRHPPLVNIEARILANRYYRFLEATWMLQHLPWAILCYWLGGWGAVCWGVCARVATGIAGHWAIGYLAHNHGAIHRHVRGAAVQGHNIRFTSLLTMGECWHNNHHAYPGSARLGLGAGEWDPGWWVLMGLKRVGLVWSVRLPEDLPARPELEEIAEQACQPRLRRFALLALR